MEAEGESRGKRSVCIEWRGDGGRRRLSVFVIVTNEDLPNAHQAQHGGGERRGRCPYS